MRDVSSGNIYYYEADMLGSARTMVQAGQTSVCYDADFLPFGQEVDFTGTCGSSYKFEGKERDLETGNDDFGARYYRSALGRWMSADWSSVPAPVPYANLTNPQTLNLYAMVGDNPETFADLDGHVNSDGGPYNLETGDISGTGQGPNCDYMGGNCSKQKNANTNVNGKDQDPAQEKNQTQEQKDNQAYHQQLAQKEQAIRDQNKGSALGSPKAIKQISGQVYGESMAGIKMDLIITAPETATAAVVTGAPAAAATGRAVVAGTRITATAASEYVLTHPNEPANFAQGLIRGPAGAPPTPAGTLGAVVNIVLKRIIP